MELLNLQRYLKRRIFIFGGNDGENYINFVESYDMAKGTWTILNVKLPWNLFSFDCFQMNQKNILIIGKSKKDSNLECIVFNMENYKIKKS